MRDLARMGTACRPFVFGPAALPFSVMALADPTVDSFPLRICLQSRECGSAVLERLAGSSLFPERPIGAAIVDALHRPGGSVACVSAPAMVDAEEQVGYYLRLGLATTPCPDDPRPPRERITLVSIDDPSSRWLSEKLFDPDLPDAAAARARLAALVSAEHAAGRGVLLCCFEPSANVERLAADLAVPSDQAPAWTIPLGTKSAGRDLFRDLGIPVAEGTPLCHDLDNLAAAMADMVSAGHHRFVLKLDSTAYGAGLGNAIVDVDQDSAAGIAAHLPASQVVDPKLGWDGFAAAVPEAGVLAEELLTGDGFRSPSFQGRLTPDGPLVVSTHEQVLAPNQQTYTGSAFPADARYRAVIIEYGTRVGEALRAKGIDRGDYGVDFIVVTRDGQPRVYACELNLRATGTRHGFDMATTLLGATPDVNGELRVDGEQRILLTSDNIVDPRYACLRPSALIDAVERSPLHYDPARREGVVLHLLSALPEHGKFGAVCVAATAEAAQGMLAELRAIALAEHSQSTVDCMDG